MDSDTKHPDDFLSVRVQNMIDPVGLVGLCAGYECSEWRAAQLATHLIEWLPEFALTYSEREGLASHNAVALIAQAARIVYTSEKYRNRGEIGELLLHVAVRQVFNTLPAISKYYYKDSENDTVKGFDAVHIVDSPNSLELWLGEVKFYTSIAKAIRDVVLELKAHFERDYLRSEFAAVIKKIDDAWSHAERLKKLLHKNTSLDEIFDCLCIPVFLTYESETITSYSAVTEEFNAAFAGEVAKHYESFRSKVLPSKFVIQLFLFPMKSKALLLHHFNERLKACQMMAG
ncbi:MAG: HamA C-terminal domain-containing protein [Syntrophobacteraceae bacterium]